MRTKFLILEKRVKKCIKKMKDFSQKEYNEKNCPFSKHYTGISVSH